MEGPGQKVTGYDFWDSIGRPRYVAAPMIDMSELAFRLLCRRYGVQLAYTPMIHSGQFLQDLTYKKSVFETCEEDRPLIAQFCANDADTFLSACHPVTSRCVAVDLNLGCPQSIAKKGRYGAFLQEDPALVSHLVRRAAQELPVPVTCKVRILEGPPEKTVQYAQMLENSGCSVLTVHGRTRDQKGEMTGLASWEVIREVKRQVDIPVIANGNILTARDVERCLRETRADAVMSAEGLLHNPALFSGEFPLVWDIVEEYLQIAEERNTPIKSVRTHLFRFMKHSLQCLTDLRNRLARANRISQFRAICNLIEETLQPMCLESDRSGEEPGTRFSDDRLPPELAKYRMPIWCCHSRPRPTSSLDHRSVVAAFLAAT